MYDSDGSLTPELRRIYEASKESMQSKDRLVFDKSITLTISILNRWVKT